MLRGLMTIVTAAAVLWHTIVGCCAHHSHACNDYSDCNSHVSHVAINDSCCHHESTGADELWCTDAVDTDVDSFPVTPCPNDHDGCCTEGSCAFATSGSARLSSVEYTNLVHPILCIWTIDSTAKILASHVHWLRVGDTPPPLGGLRIHLALNVLTI